MRRIFLCLCVALVAGLAQGHVIQSNLYIAGDGFTLEQAMADFHSQRAEQDRGPYKLLVLGDEIKRLTRRSESNAAVENLMDEARSSGVTLFVCARHLKALGLSPKDLLPGVVTVRGLEVDRPPAEWERRIPFPPDRRILSICS
jgi:intracellular sulfur oxidation DsrE/DsrF family protein